jgi:hypothetical protein
VMRVIVAALLAVVVVVVGFFAYLGTESTYCYAAFDAREAAERAGAAGRAVGFDTEVEPSGPRERRRWSEGGRRIAVTFSNGETGDDAEELRAAFGLIVKRAGGGVAHEGGGGCTEISPAD